jgi:four helix bundle protein
MKYTQFEELPVWNSAVELTVKTFEVCEDRSFDRQGDFRFQLGKCGLSIPNNIAEGFERMTTKELIQFLHISRGSAGEFRSMLHVMGRMQRFAHLEPQRQQMLKDVISISKQLKGWSDNLKSRLKT